MNLRRQRRDYDCGVACLAMLLDTDLDAVEGLLGRKVGELVDPDPPEESDGVIGVCGWEIACVLADEGIPYLHVVVPDAVGGSWFSRVGGALPVLRPLERVWDHMNAGGLTILGVPRLNIDGSLHWIVGEGTYMFDPTNLENSYEGVVDGLEVSEAILVRPGGHKEKATNQC